MENLYKTFNGRCILCEIYQSISDTEGKHHSNVLPREVAEFPALEAFMRHVHDSEGMGFSDGTQQARLMVELNKIFPI